MKVFIIGITGAVGGLLVGELLRRGDEVSGLVRRDEQRAALEAQEVDARVGQLAEMSRESLASMLHGCDAVVYCAGSNGGRREITDAIDGAGVAKAMDAARLAGVARFSLVSVMPEAWRERQLGGDEEHYFAVKKETDIAVSRSDLEWLILRPSLLLDRSATGTISLGPAQAHGEIARADVAATLAALLHEPRIHRRILELNGGSTSIDDAVRANLP